jgi:hypothetical protein
MGGQSEDGSERRTQFDGEHAESLKSVLDRHWDRLFPTADGDE